ncbi:MAG: GNAT family N-acetyltransferase, partial [Proteobacteria bacterium]|nr:GNAT family N-acetyltransferase [Pseudomonadota bacterium]
MATDSDYTCRLLDAPDAAAWREIRLQMLINAPTAFGADLALTQQIPMADIVSRVSADPENFIVGVFDDDRLVGTTGAYREIMPKRRHLGEIWGVYVDPAHRGNALSARMLTMALEKLRDIGG